MNSYAVNKQYCCLKMWRKNIVLKIFTPLGDIWRQRERDIRCSASGKSISFVSRSIQPLSAVRKHSSDESVEKNFLMKTRVDILMYAFKLHFCFYRPARYFVCYFFGNTSKYILINPAASSGAVYIYTYIYILATCSWPRSVNYKF